MSPLIFAVKASGKQVADPRKSDVPNLVKAVLATGKDQDFPDGFAQAIGLPSAMPTKAIHKSLGGHGFLGEDRDLYVVYSSEKSGLTPICIYLKHGKGAGHEMRGNFFRVSLEGQLLGAVTLMNKLDDNGQPIRAERSRSDEDINSPLIQKLFKTELSYWRNWLKKEQKSGSSKAPSPITQ